MEGITNLACVKSYSNEEKIALLKPLLNVVREKLKDQQRYYGMSFNALKLP